MSAWLPAGRYGLVSAKSCTQRLPCCLSCLPSAMWLYLKNTRLEPRAWTLDQPKIWYLWQINPLLVVQLCKETSSLALYKWAKVLRGNLRLFFFYLDERNWCVSRRNNFWSCCRCVIFAKGQKRFLDHRQPEGYDPGEDEGEAQLEIKIAGHVTPKKAADFTREEGINTEIHWVLNNREKKTRTLKMIIFNIFCRALELQHPCWQNLQTTVSDK